MAVSRQLASGFQPAGPEFVADVMHVYGVQVGLLSRAQAAWRVRAALNQPFRSGCRGAEQDSAQASSVTRGMNISADGHCRYFKPNWSMLLPLDVDAVGKT